MSQNLKYMYSQDPKIDWPPDILLISDLMALFETTFEVELRR